jgi:hypothetical protein
VAVLEAQIVQTAKAQAEATAEEAKEEREGSSAVYMVEDFVFPKRIDSLTDLETLIARLHALKSRFKKYASILFDRPEE